MEVRDHRHRQGNLYCCREDHGLNHKEQHLEDGHRGYADGGHRNQIHAGWILIGLSMFFLLWFVAALRRAVSTIDGEGILTGIVSLGGGIYAACAIVAIGIEDGIKTMSDDTFQHRVYPELIHAADERIPIDAVEFGAEAVWRAVQRFH